MPSLISVHPSSQYRLAVGFSNGFSGYVDIKPLFNKKKFAELQEIKLFDAVYIDPELGCPTRPNGADICPDQCYLLAHQSFAHANS